MWVVYDYLSSECRRDRGNKRENGRLRRPSLRERQNSNNRFRDGRRPEELSPCFIGWVYNKLVCGTRELYGEVCVLTGQGGKGGRGMFRRRSGCKH